MSSGTIRLNLIALRGFFRFVLQRGWIESDPSDGLDLPRLDQKLPRTLSERDVTALIEAIDVREPFEVEISRIPGAVLIPLGELPGRLSEVPQDRDVAVHCKAGGRSAKAVKLLRDSGWTRGSNVQGGILAWAEMDPTVKPY